jgi:hypothetical protein
LREEDWGLKYIGEVRLLIVEFLLKRYFWRLVLTMEKRVVEKTNFGNCTRRTGSLTT